MKNSLKNTLPIWIIFLFNAFLLAQQNYHDLHKKALVVDMHADVLLNVLRGANISRKLEFGHVDLPRLAEGGIDVQFFAVWPDPQKYKPDNMYKHSMYMIDLLKEIIQKNPDKISLTVTPEEIEKTAAKNKIAACIGVEGGTVIENDLQKLQNLFDAGVRYLGLTWNDSPKWASSAKDESAPRFQGQKGLSVFGKKVIKKMNELGMIVDISHSGEKTFWDVMEVSVKPVIASHSCVYNICPHYRNLKDEQIKAIGKNGGVIFINFYPGYLQKDFDEEYSRIRISAETVLDSLKISYGSDHLSFRRARNLYLDKLTEKMRPGLKKIVDHMDYIINLIGDDHVGIGSDFDGISVTPQGIKDVSEMPELTRVMLEKGYSEKRIRKIMGENFIRVFKEVTN